ncbi:MAG: RDD family protein [Azospirillaceae bacterium]|nr:RDD family protein [Azospirillaceae bacterium]
MTIIDATTPAEAIPEGVPAGWTYGGFGRRAVAAITDSLILFVASLALAVIFGYPILPSAEPGASIVTTATIVNSLLYLAYHTAFVASALRATPGKYIMDLVVAQPDGGRVTPATAFARILVQQLISLPMALVQSQAKTAPLAYLTVALLVCCLALVNYLMVAFTPQKTAGHDRICGTRVFHRVNASA